MLSNEDLNHCLSNIYWFLSRNMKKTCSFGHLSFLGADIGNDLPEERES